jgi:hypothetical protein
MSWDFTTDGQVKITMEGYTADLMQHASVIGIDRTPAADHLFHVRDVTLLESADREKFHSLVAKLLYLAKRVRPDILLPVSFLSTRVQSPDVDDDRKLRRVLKYLNGTRELGIVLGGGDGVTVTAYIDASYGVHEDGKSHSGMAVCVASGPLLVKSTKQKIVTKSSTEAELIALSDMSSNVIWIRDFLIAQGYTLPPARVYQDNQSTIALVQRGSSASERTRHVHIRYFWVKDRIDSNEIKIEYLPTDEMTADILTKPLQGDKFILLRNKLLNWIC